MANVLGTLFSDIASAIREKSGESGTMKPAEFPDKIAALEVGGGSGGASGITIKNMSFKPTSSIYTVTHNLGYIPDILIVWMDDVPTDGKIFLAVGFSSAMYEAAGRDYYGFSQFLSGGSSMTFSTNSGFESASVTNGKYGNICSVTSTTFAIGGSTAGVDTSHYYSYMAISGITG